MKKPLIKKQLIIIAAAILSIAMPSRQSLQAQTNTSTGVQALQFNTTGSSNTATGYQALRFNTKGSFNSAHGAQALLSNDSGSYNVATGYGALSLNTKGSDNTATGIATLFFNTTGSNNTATGSDALKFNTTGAWNTASGSDALSSNTTGRGNTASGASALSSNTTGSNNTATGNNTLLSNTTGEGNTAIGDGALSSNITGGLNLASGAHALSSNTTGSINTANGSNALISNTTGNENTAIGGGALLSNTTGTLNTACGANALVHNISGNMNVAFGVGAGFSNNYSSSTFIGTGADASDSVTNSTALGFEAIVTASNQVRIGNADVTSIGGQVQWTSLSDGRYKANIQEDVPGLEFINKLRPVTYTLDVEGIANKLAGSKAKTGGKVAGREETVKGRHTGFVAQEVEAVAKKLNYDFSGVDAPKNKEDLYGLRYAEFVVPLVKSVQEQQQEITALKEEIKELKEMLTKLSNGQPLTTTKNSNSTVAHLMQNAPNPFNRNTIIKYNLPQGTAAKVVISNVNGQIMRSIAINGGDTGRIILDAGTLPTGTYTYSLWVEGNKVDAKQMIIQK